MNPNQVEEIDDLLFDQSANVLRVIFTDGEIYDLTGFAVGQNWDEDFPHCSADVVQTVNFSPGKHPFASGKGMFFHFNEIQEVRDEATNQTLFRL